MKNADYQEAAKWQKKLVEWRENQSETVQQTAAKTAAMERGDFITDPCATSPCAVVLAARSRGEDLGVLLRGEENRAGVRIHLENCCRRGRGSMLGYVGGGAALGG